MFPSERGGKNERVQQGHINTENVLLHFVVATCNACAARFDLINTAKHPTYKVCNVWGKFHIIQNETSFLWVYHCVASLPQLSMTCSFVGHTQKFQDNTLWGKLAIPRLLSEVHMRDCCKQYRRSLRALIDQPDSCERSSRPLTAVLDMAPESGLGTWSVPRSVHIVVLCLATHVGVKYYREIVPVTSEEGGNGCIAIGMELQWCGRLWGQARSGKPWSISRGAEFKMRGSRGCPAWTR